METGFNGLIRGQTTVNLQSSNFTTFANSLKVFYRLVVIEPPNYDADSFNSPTVYVF